MPVKSSTKSPFSSLSAFQKDSGDVNLIIDTPKGSRNKYKFDEEIGLFKLGGVLPAGAVFPFDFGYVPSTRGGDGDPLDVLLLMDEPAFVGCLVGARLVGVIEAEQTEDGETTRNDRLIAVASDSRTHQNVRSLNNLDNVFVDEIEHFFVSYNEAKNKIFRPLGRYGPLRALKLLAEGERLFREPKKEATTKTAQRKSRVAVNKRRKRR
ncbi:MAG: inorganic diphosphatase [Pyrinomonadaceae bacterium]|nr:inorganic diphosphatase [Pyrinomonadaceae bacterium]